MHRALASPEDPIAGYKIGACTRTAQKKFELRGPVIGTFQMSGLFEDGARVDMNQFSPLGIECEVAVRLSGVDFDPKRPNSIIDTIDAVMVAFELAEWRWSDWKKLNGNALIADSFFAKASVIGPPKDPRMLFEVENNSAIFMQNGNVVYQGPLSEMEMSPVNVLRWFFTHAEQCQIEPRVGDIVLLGAVSSPRSVSSGDFFSGEIGELGTVNVEFQ